ncbi:DUF6152 family protein [Rhizobium rhizophilum]|uniref:Uncharacterized protein n=1 Tax=Rhizobium rhizophilum TaxID=1850373 RepID=A0ABY2QXU2_9HYPH|nr:DUF6152 family protein [Rhizobium rhizophilum]MBX9467398.1 hypothetical protein [Rhizobium sp.]THV14356.1 hypothetical protein E9677_15965 [Rhizobium rhizophilum]
MNRSLSLSALAGVALSAGAAMAHHGWSWAEADQIDLTGTITAISFAPPHPTLELDTADGGWRIELGNPGLTQRSGFVEGVVDVGDEITIRGNRSLDPDEKRLKAVRVIVSGKNYDIYPNRIVTN